MEVTIERILPGGFGLAHSDDRTIMVALAAPGDRVRIRVDRVKGNVSFASIEEIITPSLHRVEHRALILAVAAVAIFSS